MFYSLKEMVTHYRRQNPEVVSAQLKGRTPQKIRLDIVTKVNNNESEFVILGTRNIEEFLNAHVQLRRNTYLS